MQNVKSFSTKILKVSCKYSKKTDYYIYFNQKGEELMIEKQNK